MLDALERAFSQGELVIPTEKPAALRLHFYGLGGALRKEGKSEIFDGIAFLIRKDPSRLILSLREQTQFGEEVARALAGGNSPPQESPTSEAEAALARILGGS